MSLRSILDYVRRMEKKNLAVELLERLLHGKIKAQTHIPVPSFGRFSGMKKRQECRWSL